MSMFPPCHSPSPTWEGGFPTDLVEINLSDWASLVQDVAAGLQVLPPRLSNCLDPEVMTLLQWLEAVTQVRFCHLCYYPDTNCRCSGVPLSTPLTSWSQITEWTPGYRMTAFSGGVTTPSTSDLAVGLVRTSATSTRDLHLGHISVGDPYTPAASHNPVIQTSHWEGRMAKGRSENEGSGATGSSDCTSHLPAASTSLGSTSNPVPAGGAATK